MATFNFPYHTVSTEYPDSTFRAKLGNSYQYSAQPVAPDQRIFVLKFALMKYFQAKSGAIDRTTLPEINMALLDDFYQAHKLHSTFTYKHPVYGDLACRFNKPLKIPEGVAGGDGAIQNIEVEFIEMPGLSDSGVAELTVIQYVDFPAE